MAFLFFHGILCDTLKKSRGKNLIIVPVSCYCLRIIQEFLSFFQAKPWLSTVTLVFSISLCKSDFDTKFMFCISVWMEVMIPYSSMKHLTKFIVSYLETLLR